MEKMERMDDSILTFELKKNGQAKICVDGDIQELLAGVLTVTKSVYHSIHINDAAGAEWFLQQMGKAMVCPDHPLYKEVRE